MKKSFVLLAVLAMTLGANAQQDPVLMKINNKDVTRSEFEYIYNKNNTNNELDKKSLEEYVDLFVNFKLKVAEAENNGIDTTKAFRDEFQGYRRQLTKGYLTDDSVDDNNAKEAYEQLKENIEASHILIMVKPDATPDEVSKALAKATQARQRLIKGELFDKVAREMSEDPSAAQNGGSLGYFTAFQMVYPFEKAAFALKIGEISEPIRTDFGFHVIKVTNKRPDIGQVLVSHIFKQIKQDDSTEVEARIKAQMDSLYTALNNGADFAELAQTFSDDKGSASRGGDLPWLGFRQTLPEFEEIAFSLQKDQYSKPFRSAAGYHIVRLKDRKVIEPFEKKKEEIIRRLARQGRDQEGVEALIAKLKEEYKYTLLNQAVNQATTYVATKDSTMTFTGALFTIDGKEYPLQDFAAWAKGRSKNADQLIKEYTDKQILTYEDSKLEQKYPDFGHLMNEYRDGILLFEISNRLVWDKASKDHEGLTAFFKKNKSDYKWSEPRYKGLILHCNDPKLEKEIKKFIKKLPKEQWLTDIRKTYNNDSVQVVKVEKGLYSKGDNKYVDKLVFKTGTFEPLSDFPHTSVIGKMLKKGPEVYSDAKGPVTADYQNFLESAWIKELRSKYMVEINQEVLKTVNNH